MAHREGSIKRRSCYHNCNDAQLVSHLESHPAFKLAGQHYILRHMRRCISKNACANDAKILLCVHVPSFIAKIRHATANMEVGVRAWVLIIHQLWYQGRECPLSSAGPNVIVSPAKCTGDAVFCTRKPGYIAGSFALWKLFFQAYASTLDGDAAIDDGNAALLSCKQQVELWRTIHRDYLNLIVLCIDIQTTNSDIDWCLAAARGPSHGTQQSDPGLWSGQHSNR